MKKLHEQKTNKGVRTGRKIKDIAALKKEARSNQKKLIQYLENKENRNPRGSHRMRETRKATRSFWLSNCIAITATVEEIKEIANHPDVAEIVENVILSIPPIAANDIDESSGMDFWNHALIGMDEVKQLGFDGSHIRVGHLDTGIDPYNSELKGKLIAWAEFGLDGEKIESLPHDSHPLGHRTHTASVIAGETTGIAPGVSIISALVLDEGYGIIIQALAGMQWVLDPADNDPDTDDGAQIVNMSWGTPGTLDLLNEAIKNMKDAGVLPVCAIGNSGYGTTLSPGNAPDAVGVGAVGRNDYVSGFSGGEELFWGDLAIVKPDMIAPGVDIPGIGLDGAYQSMSGTSFAAPHVAGAAAILMEHSPDL